MLDQTLEDDSAVKIMRNNLKPPVLALFPREQLAIAKMHSENVTNAIDGIRPSIRRNGLAIGVSWLWRLGL